MPDLRFDSRLYDLIPHRPPMLLINKVLDVDERSSSSLVRIDESSSFFEKEHGVPAWIGLEYMGQTAALIAGHQLQQGLVSPHLGFLLGTRAYKAECSYFTKGEYTVRCEEKAVVGDGLATFDCFIENYNETSQTIKCLATASLSVFRRQI
ncbi:MAG: 3-hydroxydecanoyl-ACP dehydratase [Alteromonadaceae bacterium]|nr:3-hydroxydecanoyl-ACP dehydratase [Alteromonadaceae bacterium]